MKAAWAVGCLALLLAMQGASRAEAQLFECRDWRADVLLPAAVPLRLLGTTRLRDGDALSAEIMIDEVKYNAEITSLEKTRTSVAFFTEPDGTYYVAVADDGAAMAIVEGNAHPVVGGVLLSPREVDRLGDLRGPLDKDCYRLPEEPTLLSEKQIRKRGIDPDATVAVREEAPPVKAETPEPPAKRLSELREALVDDGAEEAAPGPEAVAGGGIAGLFSESETATEPPAAELPLPAPEVETADTAVRPEDVDTVMSEVIAEIEDFPAAVCIPGDATAQAYDDGPGSEGFAVAGRLMDGGEVPVYRQAAEGSEDVIPEAGGFRRVAGGAGDQLRRLDLPFGLQIVDDTDGTKLQPIRPVDMALLETAAGSDPSPVAAPVAKRSALMRLLVIGDADTTAVSGLDQLEAELVADFGAAAWDVSWAQVQPDGTLAPEQAYGSLAEVVAAAAPQDSAFFPADDAAFDRQMDAVEALLTGEGPVVDQVFFLQEGYKLPHNVPSRFDAMIQRVQSAGRIDRFPDGRARKWLHVIAGSFAAEFSQAYLAGPLQTTGAGYLVVSPGSGGERTRILEDTSVSLGVLNVILARRLSESGEAAPKVVTADAAPEPTGPGAIGGAEDLLLFPRTALVADLGVVVRKDMLIPFLASLSGSVAAIAQIDSGAAPAIEPGLLDMAGLMALRTDRSGALRPAMLDPKGLERTLKAFDLRRGEGFRTKLVDWQTSAMQQATPLLARVDCGYFYFSATSLAD